jgi:hypothetical protein
MKRTLKGIEFATDIKINCSFLLNADVVETVADSIPRLLELGIYLLQNLGVCLVFDFLEAVLCTESDYIFLI